MKKEYIIVGSDNFWYACDLHSMKEVKSTIQDIIKNPENYSDPETGERRTEPPETFYVYEGFEVAQCDMTEKDWDKELVD